MAVLVRKAGTLITVTATFESIAGAPTNPTTVTIKFQPPGAPAVTWVFGGFGSITNPSVGEYVAEIDSTGFPGPWKGDVIGTGACQVAESFAFNIDPLAV